MTHSAQANFEFSLQQVPELFVSCALVAKLRAVMPAGCKVRLLPKSEQAKGDLEVAFEGKKRYIEIKIEAYPSTLFLEPFQMWAYPGELRFRRSWAFTTTADSMLYIGPKHTHGLLVPRRAWLKTGLELMEAAMLSSANAPMPFTPNLSLNSRPDGQGGRRFTGAAAGVALGVDLWMTALAEVTPDTQHLLLTDFGDLMPSALEMARRCEQDAAPVVKLMSEVMPEQEVRAAASMLARWAVRVAPPVSGPQAIKVAEECEKALRAWRELTGFGELFSPAQAFEYWLESPLPEDCHLPVAHPTMFLAHACFESSWANGGGSDDVAHLMNQAKLLQLLPQRGQEGVWPRALERKCHLRTFGSKAHHGARPANEVVLEQWRARKDLPRRKELMQKFLAPSRESSVPSTHRYTHQD